MPVNAMYKLRQRNSHVVRFAEYDKGREEMYFDQRISTETAGALSEHLASLCANTEFIYTRESDLEVGQSTSWSSDVN